MERDQRVPRRPGSRSPVGRADPGRGHNSMERRSPTGIAWSGVSDRHRAGARNLHRRRRAPPISRPGAPVSDRHRAGARNPVDDAAPRQSHGQERRSPTGIGGIAKPAPTTLAMPISRPGAPVSDRHRAGARNPHRRRWPPISRPGAPVSDRHRAGARNPHRRRWPCQSHGLERRSLTGIARERETRADDTAPCQRECRTPSQHRMPRSLTAPLPAAVPLLTAPAKTPANKLRPARPSDGKGNRAATSP